MEPKSLFASKTFWLGTALVAYNAVLAYLQEFSSSDPVVGMVAGFLVVVNRYFTDRPIK